jgi:hypothetical protein
VREGQGEFFLKRNSAITYFQAKELKAIAAGAAPVVITLHVEQQPRC